MSASDDADGLSSKGGLTASVLEPWGLRLVRQQGAGSLVAIAREGRLTCLTESGSVRVGLTLVDETVLALVDLAMERRQNLTFVYPAPAGEVSILLAAQILIRRFVQGARSQSVGVVTSDTATATRTWEKLGIAAPGSRTPISDVFPCYRAGPEGENPLGRRSFRGVLIGRRFGDWPVDVVVVDHLSGPVFGEPHVPVVRVFADPLDPALDRLSGAGELIWGWSESDLVLDAPEADEGEPLLPFSVASHRLETMAAGVQTTFHVAHALAAEMCVRRLRDDLDTLGEMYGPTPSRPVLRGLRIAWQHVTTLTSLPCKPSEFDRYAGMPPIAARATRTFEPEMAAWARTLGGDATEIAEVIASDLGDLRAALEESKPFSAQLREVATSDEDTLIVVRTHTAARGLLFALGGDPNLSQIGRCRIVAVRRLHREGTWDRALVVGTPPRWDWHRFDSGLTPELHVLVLGERDAYLGRGTLMALRRARARWAGASTRGTTWRKLLGTDPPVSPPMNESDGQFSIVDALEPAPDVDPFEAFESLLLSTPLVIGEEGPEDFVAQQTEEGHWLAAVPAVEVVTDAGIIKLPCDRSTDVRKGERVVECRAEDLEVGTYLLLDRRGGGVGLLEAVAERLKKHRPDLLAANLLISDFRTTVQRTFRESGMTGMGLYERLRDLGFEKTYQAARGYVNEGGPLAPRDLPDVQRLNQALGLGLSDLRITEIFAGVQRQRTFRRAAGRALMAAARGSTAAAEATRVDHDTGLSVADLRELVLEAEVLEVRRLADPVSLAEIGHLE